MNRITLYKLLFIVIHYAQLICLIEITISGLSLFKDTSSYNDIKFISCYSSLLWVFEFYSIANYCVCYRIEGLIHLLSLKFSRYLCFFTSLFAEEFYKARVYYIGLDIILIMFVFMNLKSTLRDVLHRYNLAVGLEIKVRNSFIVSENQ